MCYVIGVLIDINVITTTTTVHFPCTRRVGNTNSSLRRLSFVKSESSFPPAPASCLQGSPSKSAALTDVENIPQSPPPYPSHSLIVHSNCILVITSMGIYNVCDSIGRKFFSGVPQFGTLHVARIKMGLQHGNPNQPHDRT